MIQIVNCSALLLRWAFQRIVFGFILSHLPTVIGRNIQSYQVRMTEYRSIEIEFEIFVVGQCWVNYRQRHISTPGDCPSHSGSQSSNRREIRPAFRSGYLFRFRLNTGSWGQRWRRLWLNFRKLVNRSESFEHGRSSVSEFDHLRVFSSARVLTSSSAAPVPSETRPWVAAAAPRQTHTLTAAVFLAAVVRPLDHPPSMTFLFAVEFVEQPFGLLTELSAN